MEGRNYQKIGSGMHREVAARKIFAKPEGQQRKAFAALRKKMRMSDALAMELDD